MKPLHPLSPWRQYLAVTAFAAGAMLFNFSSACADEVKGRLTHDITVGSAHDIQLKSQSPVQVMKQSGTTDTIMVQLPDGSNGVFEVDAANVEILAPSPAPATTASTVATVATNAAPATPAPAASTTAPVAAAMAKKEPAPTPSPYVPPGYTEVFGDEFNESSLDISKWWTRYIYNDGMLDHLNDEAEHYRENNNHVLTGNSLQLTGRIVGGGKYESGLIRSKMTFKYGYFEAKLKMPPGKGMWPAFWLNADSTPDGKVGWPPEIDILEFVNNVKDDKVTMFHMGAVAQKKKDGGPAPQSGKVIFLDPAIKGGGEYSGPDDFTQDFHTFALLWDTDDTITWYLDGKELMKREYKWTRNSGEDAPNAHVLLNLAMGGHWAGRYGIDNAAFPQSLEVDYVRIYQKTGQQTTGQSTIGTDLYKPPTP